MDKMYIIKSSPIRKDAAFLCTTGIFGIITRHISSCGFREKRRKEFLNEILCIEYHNSFTIEFPILIRMAWHGCWYSMENKAKEKVSNGTDKTLIRCAEKLWQFNVISYA